MTREYNGTTNQFVFTYDASCSPVSVTMNGEVFYYVTNLQGDVVALLDEDSYEVGSYEYTAYGNVSITMGHPVVLLNPLLYRGYVHDLEIGLYYLQSRYYDPNLGRFLNADALVATGQGVLGNNMFAYCGNNPIANVDPSGSAFLPSMSKMNEGDNPRYILDQNDSPYSSLPLGSTTVGEMGCAIVATYNALLSMGHHKPFLDVYSYFTSHPLGAPFGGIFGIPFTTVVSFFSDNGYTVVPTIDPLIMDYFSSSADAAILLYNQYVGKLGHDNFNIGGHFIEYSPYQDRFLGRNTGGLSGTEKFLSPSEYGYRESRFFAISILIYESPT